MRIYFKNKNSFLIDPYYDETSSRWADKQVQSMCFKKFDILVKVIFQDRKRGAIAKFIVVPFR